MHPAMFVSWNIVPYTFVMNILGHAENFDCIKIGFFFPISLLERNLPVFDRMVAKRSESLISRIAFLTFICFLVCF